MAIATTEFLFLYAAHQAGKLPRGGSILDFGETEIVNIDVPEALRLLVPAGPEQDSLTDEALVVMARNAPRAKYELARIVYRAMLGFDSYHVIDMEPGENYYQQDLNEPFNLGQQFDICINTGTSEHVFNQANFFKAMHDHTKPGGHMIHYTPCLGWIDHGFYNVQPSFFGDLALENGYDVVAAALATPKELYPLDASILTPKFLAAHPDLSRAMACAVLKKGRDSAFRNPIQNLYSELRAVRDAKQKSGSE
jgi:SAM-dependent methyltransferase